MLSKGCSRPHSRVKKIMLLMMMSHIYYIPDWEFLSCQSFMDGDSPPLFSLAVRSVAPEIQPSSTE